MDTVSQSPATRRFRAPRLAGWWEGPCGLAELIGLALPLVVSMLAFALNQFFDRLYLTWYSSVAVAAVVPSGALAWVASSFPLGLAMYTTAFVAQYYGSGNYRKIGQVVWHTLYFAAATIPAFIVIGWFATPIFAWFAHAPEMQAGETVYFRILTYGLGTGIAAEALSSFFIGTGKTSRVMWVNLASVAVNIVLDYVMIFGKFGCPEMGIAGAAWATTIAAWFKLAVLAAMAFEPHQAVRYGLTSGWRFSLPMIGRLLRYGAPQGVHFFLEGGAITIFIILMGGISVTASAATAIAFSVNMVAFVPLIGLGIGLTTLVGREIGRQQIPLARRATRSALVLGTAYALMFALLYYFAPTLFVGVHEWNSSHTKPEIVTARWLLQFVALYCIFDSFQILFQAAIKGAGDTLYVLLVSVISSTLFVTVGYLGAGYFAGENAKLTWWWWCLTIWILGLTITYLLRYLGGKWTRMSVIEPELVSGTRHDPFSAAVEP